MLNPEQRYIYEWFKDISAKLSVKHLKKAAHKKVSRRTHKLLTLWGRKMVQQYDLTNESDIKDYLSWFEDMDRKVSNAIVRKFASNIEHPELFVEMCTEHNKRYIEEDEDTVL